MLWYGVDIQNKGAVMTMESIKMFVSPTGAIIIRLPEGCIPDRATLERVSEMIQKQRKKAAA
jgi:hypothetical protein